MACDTITDLLVQETGRFGPEIYNRVFPVSPWVGLVKRGAFPEEMGDTISVLTYERAAPVGAEYTGDWTALTITGTFGSVNGRGTAEGGSCLPTAEKVTVAQTARTYALKRKVLEGPDFCVTDLRYKFQLRKQLESIIGILAGYSQITWESRYRHDYSTLTEKKMICDATWNTTGFTQTGTYSAEQPTSLLTQGMLDWARTKLMRDGAILSALGKNNGAPVLTLVCSAETSNDLIFRNADIRQDLRWGKPSELLAGYGVTRDYKNFYHVIDPFPRRFNWTDGALVEVAPFVEAAATYGNKAIVNTLWESAAYEESHIFDPEVFHSLIPAPITNPAPNFQFDPVTYLGDWKLKNIPDRDCNPDGTIVFHRGHLAHAPEPVHPERGFSFIHLRCDPCPNLITDCTCT